MFSRAKLKYCPYWPAIVIKRPSHLKPRKKKSCVLFLGTKNYGFVDAANIVNYTANRSAMIQRGKGGGFNQAVAQMDQYISDPKTYRENVTINPLNEDVQIKEEPDQSDDENEGNMLPTMHAVTNTNKEKELIDELVKLKASNSSMFFELRKCKETIASLELEKETLSKHLNETNTANMDLKSKLQSTENEKKKLMGRIQQLQKGVNLHERHESSQKAKTACPVNDTKQNDVDDTYDVEQLLDHKWQGRKQFFLVRWANYDESHNSWVAKKDLDCPKLLMEYFNSNKNTL